MRKPATAALSRQEAAAHLTDAQLLQVLTDACIDLGQGRPLRQYRFDTAEVLRSFRTDRTLDEKLSAAIGALGSHTRAELAAMIALRGGIALVPRTANLDEVIAAEAEALRNRQVARREADQRSA